MRGHDVILVERRVPWDAPDTPFGPQWPDRNTRWHLVDDVPAATSVGALLDTVDDPRRAFYR